MRLDQDVYHHPPHPRTLGAIRCIVMLLVIAMATACSDAPRDTIAVDSTEVDPFETVRLETGRPIHAVAIDLHDGAGEREYLRSDRPLDGEVSIPPPLDPEGGIITVVAYDEVGARASVEITVRALATPPDSERPGQVAEIVLLGWWPQASEVYAIDDGYRFLETLDEHRDSARSNLASENEDFLRTADRLALSMVNALAKEAGVRLPGGASSTLGLVLQDSDYAADLRAIVAETSAVSRPLIRKMGNVLAAAAFFAGAAIATPTAGLVVGAVVLTATHVLPPLILGTAKVAVEDLSGGEPTWRTFSEEVRDLAGFYINKGARVLLGIPHGVPTAGIVDAAAGALEGLSQRFASNDSSVGYAYDGFDLGSDLRPPSVPSECANVSYPASFCCEGYVRDGRSCETTFVADSSEVCTDRLQQYCQPLSGSWRAGSCNTAPSDQEFCARDPGPDPGPDPEPQPSCYTDDGCYRFGEGCPTLGVCRNPCCCTGQEICMGLSGGPGCGTIC